MNNSILIKTFEGNNIRVTTVVSEVYFVGKDVAEVLGYSNTRDAIAYHVWDEYKADVGIFDGSQHRNMVCISEQGVYQLVFGSKKPEARRFQRWVIEDVLPSIRQTGGYSIKPTSPQSFSSSIEEELKVAELIGNKIEAKFNNSSIGKQLALKAISIAVPPKYLPVLEEAKTKLAEENATPSNQLYTATDIAKELCEKGLVQYNTARKVNTLLEKLGLQTKPKKNWKATTKAKSLDLCSELEIMASLTQKNNKWVGKQLRWKEAVIGYIIDQLEELNDLATTAVVEAASIDAEVSANTMPAVGQNKMTDCFPDWDIE